MVYGVKYPRGFANEFQVCAFETEESLEFSGYKRISRDYARKLTRPNYFKYCMVQDWRYPGNVVCKSNTKSIEYLESIINDPELLPLPPGAPRRLVII